ncbi:hypothetical protein [Psychroflexus aestuariivivens]|uniref:hypothetical protein n=1 Tax=Psychroflexus aestuariivivens TaxID=1795040 RepID=UPI000FD72F22|nr:hypothetical protein [Psychroflexus aestuariivivens]
MTDDKKKIKKDYGIKKEKTKALLDSLTKNDKRLILKAFMVMNHLKIKLPKTEFIRLNLLISIEDDIDMFYKNADDTTIYSLVINEISEEEIQTLKNLKKVFISLQLSSFHNSLVTLKRKIHSKKEIK